MDNETVEFGKYTLEAVEFDWYENPRMEDGNLGRACVQSSSAYAWEGTPFWTLQDAGGWSGWAEADQEFLKAAKAAGEEVAILLPVWKYEHGGIMIKASEGNPFGCPFDSGRVGWVYATRKDILDRWMGKRLTKKLLAQAEKAIKEEVEYWSHYLNNDGYEVKYWLTADGEDADKEYAELDTFCEFDDDAIKEAKKWLVAIGWVAAEEVV